MIKLNAPDPLLNRIQDNVDQALTVLGNLPLNGGVLLSGVALISGQDNLVAHGLQAVPNIWVSGVPNADARIWSPSTSTLGNASANAQYINLRCSADCTASVWVSRVG